MAQMQLPARWTPASFCRRPSRHVVTRIQAIAASGERPVSYKTRTELENPLHIGASAKSTLAVQDLGSSGSPNQASSTCLSTYMMLPVEQYFVLDPSQVAWLGGSTFLLTVPRIHLFNLWIEPVVEVTVSSQAWPPRVLLKASNCIIRGSESIQRLRLDERFALTFTTQLSWASAGDDGGSTGAERRAESGSSASSSSGMADSTSSSAVGLLTASTDIDVWCEVVPPFHLMPRSALQATCNSVLARVANTLLPVFLKQLAADYAKWATKPEYRAQRAARSAPAPVAAVSSAAQATGH